jgi:signal transduction histidine kinase/ActR/RegA family two-component response regulator
MIPKKHNQDKQQKDLKDLMEYHRILKNQIDRFFRGRNLDDECFALFLESVNNTYVSMEQDKQMADHVFSISEREYQEVLEDLRVEMNIKLQSINKLKEAIRTLAENDNIDFSDNENDIISIINFLKEQIEKTKALEQELIASKNIAEHALKAKSEFLAVMSHEIRTPLNAIIGNIYLLQQQETSTEQETFLTSLKVSAENLLCLINDILDFGKIEEGKITFKSKAFNIRKILQNIKDSNSKSATARGNEIHLAIDTEIPENIIGDEIRLHQIINNLLTNAIKFTQNGTIDIKAQLTKTENETVDIYFAVSDTGIGIKQEQQTIIFERFTQANSNNTRQYGGSGLGLTIVKRLLQLQNSDIQLESELGKGSRFYFTLTFKTKNMTQLAEIQPTTKDLKGKRILLVEDFIFNIMVAQKMLETWNAIVDVAENGEIAVDKAKTNDYDLILMDLQMPIMDGIEATQVIREFNKKIPIIALTATASSEMQAEVLKIGMNDYLSKPFNPDELFSTVYQYTIAKN